MSSHNKDTRPLVAVPSGFYTSWNLSKAAQEKLDLYELWDTSIQSLQLHMYSAVWEPEKKYSRYILYRGSMYEVKFLYEAFEKFMSLLPEAESYRFIISLRKCTTVNGEQRVALVQYKRRGKTVRDWRS